VSVLNSPVYHFNSVQYLQTMNSAKFAICCSTSCSSKSSHHSSQHHRHQQQTRQTVRNVSWNRMRCGRLLTVPVVLA